MKINDWPLEAFCVIGWLLAAGAEECHAMEFIEATYEHAGEPLPDTLDAAIEAYCSYRGIEPE